MVDRFFFFKQIPKDIWKKVLEKKKVCFLCGSYLNIYQKYLYTVVKPYQQPYVERISMCAFVMNLASFYR